MSSQRQYLKVHAMSALDGAADEVSSIVPVQYHSMVSVQAIWTNTMSGTLTFQISDTLNRDGTVSTWSTVTLDKTLSSPAGSGGSSYGQLNVCAADAVRVIYTATSGAGILDVWIVAKGL